MKILTHDGREIENDAVDYRDGIHVMIRYTDTDEIAIIRKSEIKSEDRPDDDA